MSSLRPLSSASFVLVLTLLTACGGGGSSAVQGDDGTETPTGDTVLPPSASDGVNNPDPVDPVEQPGGDDTPVDPPAPIVDADRGELVPTTFASQAHAENGNLLPAASGTLSFEEVTASLTRPWGFAALPDGAFVVTEKAGSIRVVDAEGGVSVALAGVPAVDDTEQGGMLDVVASPSFASDQTIFFCYSEPVGNGEARIAVARATLGASSLSDVSVIFRQSFTRSGGIHYGSRMVFDANGYLMVSLGERNFRPNAQSLANTAGSVIRIATDGSVPADNPFVNTAGAVPEIYSYGHRSPQGLTLNPADGKIWLSEHGPQGGDEINLIRPGENYGWADISYGVEYDSGVQVGQGTSAPGMTAPTVYWTPVSIAPGGAVYYNGAGVPALNNRLLVSGMRAQALISLEFSGDEVISEARYATSRTERIRDVEQGVDGFPYVITDTGRLLRLRQSS